MRENIPEESVDLIYLDPPFNSKRLYNAFIGGAQWVAFDDTWRWHEAIEDFDQVAGRPRYKGIMEGLRMMLGEDSQLAYMANRLVECHRVLKPTGSIYLHCDPTMSHYLKAVMDGIFGRRNFRNEVIWAYRGGECRNTILLVGMMSSYDIPKHQRRYSMLMQSVSHIHKILLIGCGIRRGHLGVHVHTTIMYRIQMGSTLKIGGLYNQSCHPQRNVWATQRRSP